MVALAGTWSHAIAAVLFGLLALWQFTRHERRVSMAILGIAFLLTAVWAGLAAATDPGSVAARLGETARNLGFLTFMYVLLRRGLGDDRRPFVGLVYIALFLLVVLQVMIDGALALLPGGEELNAIALASMLMLNLCFAIGALLLVHALYTVAAPETRWGIRPTMIGITAMWAYDLNLYTFAWLTGRVPFELLALRGVLMLCLVPTFLFAMRRNVELKVKLSRKVAFRSLSLLAIAGYFLIMFLATELIDIFAGSSAALVQVAIVFLLSVGAITLLPSKRVRAWLRVKIAKHLFEHRYDYRAEWIRFNHTLAQPGSDTDPLDKRIIQALADITEAQGGLLLVRSGDTVLQPGARWSWDDLGAVSATGDSVLGDWLETSGHIVELDPLRCGEHGNPDEIATLVPGWMIAQADAWALVPLIHRDKLAGAVLLRRPRIDRTLDWEDLDLLRIAGRQAASYLAEASSQDALAEARRFDEFNRRFAFILHDIKNLVSQLSLVARNAERHADNPEFRADMIATLQDSVGKMNDLLARLAPKERRRSEAPRPTGVRKLAEQLAEQKGDAHPVHIAAGPEFHAMVDPVRLETALTHLVQNAIDASAPDTPVCLTVDGDREAVRIAIEDRGVGMDAEFVREKLFRPFSSSKSGGFGIGAFEARSLVAEMGGTVDVDSREGEGTCFTISLPAAASDTGLTKRSA
ncbi:XrtA/PEP-CTERM system histidine kinase PrsK [Parasphingopyxis lamellibrachiae]|uniref:histidine kinase n=1 Tax=Parasphingopyxis lamellibrachiae TaxID=680125 RepID=A0A3D9FGU8_9SPHN|nr:XrtA/PEP-CTERM system histidine kinase PrsK [Parasphingopyxis lamellibrachiae]RED16868.1 multi-sensor signal transduction histidine kinase [Parasphingopyxis lamellibrachiae]